MSCAIFGPSLSHYLSILGYVVVSDSADRFTVPDTINIISVTDAGAGLGYRRQLPTILPSKGPTGPVKVAKRIADGIVGIRQR